MNYKKIIDVMLSANLIIIEIVFIIKTFNHEFSIFLQVLIFPSLVLFNCFGAFIVNTFNFICNWRLGKKKIKYYSSVCQLVYYLIIFIYYFAFRVWYEAAAIIFVLEELFLLKLKLLLINSFLCSILCIVKIFILIDVINGLNHFFRRVEAGVGE